MSGHVRRCNIQWTNRSSRQESKTENWMGHQNNLQQDSGFHEKNVQKINCSLSGLLFPIVDAYNSQGNWNNWKAPKTFLQQNSSCHCVDDRSAIEYTIPGKFWKVWFLTVVSLSNWRVAEWKGSVQSNQKHPGQGGSANTTRADLSSMLPSRSMHC